MTGMSRLERECERVYQRADLRLKHLERFYDGRSALERYLDGTVGVTVTRPSDRYQVPVVEVVTEP